jgi:fumarate reductase flavoprotein subunit/NADH-quinone oxidoreductase subunit F
MNILETVRQMNQEEVRDRVFSAHIHNHGVSPYLLSEYWRIVQDEAKKEALSLKVIAGLDNSDTVGVFLELLKIEPLKVMQGMCIAAYALDTKAIVLHIPEYAAGLADELSEKAKAYQIEIALGLIDPRNYRGSVVHHIAAMADLADLFAGVYQDGVYVSINGEELKKVSKDLKIREIAAAAADRTIKGLEIGYRLYGTDALDLTVEEAAVTNGLIRTITEQDCLVKLARDRLLVSQKLACGKCVFCREGLIQLMEMHKDITGGKGKQEYLEIMEEIGKAMEGGSLCSMGRQAPQIALSAQKCFYNEYEQHIKKKACLAGTCFSLKLVYIDPNTCTGCGKCIGDCPQDAILGKKGYIHMIDTLDCIQCGACVGSCDEGSIVITENRPPKLPERLTKCGRFKR